MRVEIRQVESLDDENAVISAVQITESIRNASEILKKNGACIPAIMGNDTYMVRTDQIYYIESVDKRTYVYTKEKCYETKYRLYELEGILGFSFLRCSKAMIVNIRKIRSVRAELNARMSVEMLNSERLIISRGYVKELKRKLGV
ncbi:MAG: LytTR family transcriptional regulator DNA-binding domain-containing protein [Lachnospiraceae bacterium]|nr:LytTR family transcriptional regulator DNA-binding domain-containing protein [Lachnospiraceae bacterium]